MIMVNLDEPLIFTSPLETNAQIQQQGHSISCSCRPKVRWGKISRQTRPPTRCFDLAPFLVPEDFHHAVVKDAFDIRHFNRRRSQPAMRSTACIKRPQAIARSALRHHSPQAP